MDIYSRGFLRVYILSDAHYYVVLIAGLKKQKNRLLMENVVGLFFQPCHKNKIYHKSSQVQVFGRTFKAVDCSDAE